jgi:hypothetical protein
MIDEGLKQFASKRQLEVLASLNKHNGNQKAAAKELGINQSNVSRALAALHRRAAIQGHSPAHDMTRTVPEPFVVRGVSTYYNKDGKPSGQWVKSRIDDTKLLDAVRDAVLTLVEDVRGLADPIPAPATVSEDLLCVYPMGDPHFGMHAWMIESGDDFDLKIAEKLTLGAIDRLVNSAPPAKTALLLNLGDMFHADNQKNLSVSGHQLDVDGRWAKVQQVGLRSTIHCIKRLLTNHEKVIFKINRGNHDGHSAYALALMISCYFENEPRVEVDLSPAAVWYYKFGQVLLGTTHGDTIKGPDMPSVMAADRPKDWGHTVHRYWYVGHVHHHDSREYRGCIVEYFRTLAAKDAWHAGQGYRAGRDMRLIVIHKEHGEIERHTCDIGMI